MSRRRRQGPGSTLVVISWRDIPAQVIATGDGRTAKVLLDRRFQLAIDRAAGVAGLNDAHAYVAQWRRQTRAMAGDPTEAAAEEVARIDAAYPRARLTRLVRNGGLEASDATDAPVTSPAPRPARREREEMP